MESPAPGRERSVTVTGETITILHVDDDADFVDVVGTYLEEIADRIRVETETDPDAALERVREETFDAVVSDLEMPRTSGMDLLEAIREDDPDLPFILFTGKGSEEIASEAISKGVTDYLQKGVGIDRYEVLANRVTNAVERHRAKREAEHARQAMNAAWDGISIIDDEGRFTYVNDAYAAVVGYDPTALVGEELTTCYPPGETSKVHEEILPTVRDVGIWTGETALERADGTEFSGAHVVAGLDDGGAVCVVRDLTERRELDRTLKRERDRFRLFVENVDEYAIVTLDPDGHVSSWNEGAKRIEGYEYEEIIGQHISVFFPAEAVASNRPETLLERARQEGSVTDRGRRVRRDGSTFWAEMTITALYEDGTLRGFGKVTKDITDQIERERKQERNEQFRQWLYHLTSDTRLPFQEKIRFLLQLCAERLNVDQGMMTRIEPETDYYEVVEVAYEDRGMVPGDTFPLSEVFCRRAITSDEALGIRDITTGEWADDPATELMESGCYVGSKISVGDDLFGTACFFDADPREEPFDHADKVFVDLVGRWLALELHVHGDLETHR